MHLVCRGGCLQLLILLVFGMGSLAWYSEVDILISKCILRESLWCPHFHLGYVSVVWLTQILARTYQVVLFVSEFSLFLIAHYWWIIEFPLLVLECCRASCYKIFRNLTKLRLISSFQIHIEPLLLMDSVSECVSWYLIRLFIKIGYKLSVLLLSESLALCFLMSWNFGSNLVVDWLTIGHWFVNHHHISVLALCNLTHVFVLIPQVLVHRISSWPVPWSSCTWVIVDSFELVKVSHIGPCFARLWTGLLRSLKTICHGQRIFGKHGNVWVVLGAGVVWSTAVLLVRTYHLFSIRI